jgi:hypothetical protein
VVAGAGFVLRVSDRLTRHGCEFLKIHNVDAVADCVPGQPRRCEE